MLQYLTLLVALCAPCTDTLCATRTHTKQHLRVARAVFDIIPTVDPTMGETGQQHMVERQAGDRCNCPDSEHMVCFLDTKLKCRVSLQMEVDSSWATMKKLGTETTEARRGKFKKNKKKQLRKLFAKWLEQKKRENAKT